MDTILYDLIRRTKDTASKNFRTSDVTHIAYVPTQQFITIKRENLQEFWEGYCKLVYKGDGTYSLAEMNEKDMPVVTIMTFQFNRESIADGVSLFTDKFLLELIYAWQQALTDKLHLSENKTELTCVALESDKPWQEGNSTYYQVRLQFPFCKTESSIISKIRERAISILRRRNATRQLEVAPEGDWDKIIDPLSHLEPLLMYKSVRTQGRPMMTFNNVYDEITQEHFNKDFAPVFELNTTFEPGNHTHFDQGLISDDIFEDSNGSPDKDDAMYWLPFILSVNYSKQIVLPRNDDAFVRSISSNDGSLTFDENSSNLDRARFFLQYLSPDRAVDEFSWKDVGRALYSSSNGSEDGLQTWIEFTNRNDRFGEEECIAQYRNFESEPWITYRTLAWYAKLDSPDEYKAWHDDWCREALEKALSLQHGPVAQYIYRLYWLEIACAEPDKSIWYIFNGTRWCRGTKTVTIPDKIMEEVIPSLEKLRIEVSKHVNAITNRVEKQADEVRIKNICELIAKLNDHRFIGPIIKTAVVPFHKPYSRFFEFMDNNPNLMGHADCVTEADERGITLRPGKPEDYVTMSSGMYLQRYKLHWGNPQVKEVMDWIRKIHTNDELRHEFLKEVSSWLRGRNINKRLPIWTGEKDNSKSMIIRCLELSFGQYFGKFPTSSLTGKRTQSSSATPELARARGKHVMFIQETDEDSETIRKGIAKEWTGTDSMFTRGLYDGGSEFLPMFKLGIVCNKVPIFIGNDPAIKERVKIIPFLSTWYDPEDTKANVPEDPEEQYRQGKFFKDSHFEVRIPILAPALLWVLIQYYPKYISEGFKRIPIVGEYTKKYWENQDYYELFVEDMIDKVYMDADESEPDTSVTLTHEKLCKCYKDWLLRSVGKIKQPTNMEIKDAFLKKGWSFENKRWVGVRVIRDDDVANC